MQEPVPDFPVAKDIDWGKSDLELFLDYLQGPPSTESMGDLWEDDMALTGKVSSVMQMSCVQF